MILPPSARFRTVAVVAAVGAFASFLLLSDGQYQYDLDGDGDGDGDHSHAADAERRSLWGAALDPRTVQARAQVPLAQGSDPPGPNGEPAHIFDVEEAEDGCVRLSGTVSLPDAGASIHGVLRGPSLRRVRFSEEEGGRGAHRYRFGDVSVCRNGSYAFDVRVDWIDGRASKNCRNRFVDVLLAPVVRDDGGGGGGSHFASFSVGGGWRGGTEPGEWVRTEGGECAPADACLPHEADAVRRLREQNPLALGGWRDDSPLGACLASILWDDEAASDGTDRTEAPCRWEANRTRGDEGEAWAWIPADGADIASPLSIARGLAELRRWGRQAGAPGGGDNAFWLHWVSDSIDARGPVNVLLNLLDAIQAARSPGARRRTLCFAGGEVREDEWACGERRHVSQTYIHGGEGTGFEEVNVWTWELGPDWTVHVTFLFWPTKAAIARDPALLSNLLEATSRAGHRLPPRPHAAIVNYGLHFRMGWPDEVYGRQVRVLLDLLRRQLDAVGGGDGIATPIVWRRTAMTHFEEAPLSNQWMCRSPERLYELDRVAMDVVREGGAEYVLDALTLTETRPNATQDNRHYEPWASNIPFILLCELIRLLAQVAPRTPEDGR